MESWVTLHQNDPELASKKEIKDFMENKKELADKEDNFKELAKIKLKKVEEQKKWKWKATNFAEHTRVLIFGKIALPIQKE